MKQELDEQEWLDIETAPRTGTIELRLEPKPGIYIIEYGEYDEVEGRFRTARELWPISLDPIAWRPIPSFDWKPVVRWGSAALIVIGIVFALGECVRL